MIMRSKKMEDALCIRGGLNMKILYFGLYSDDEIHTIKMTHQEPFYVAQFSYEQALCEELLKKPNMEIDFITVFQTGYYPKDRLIWRRHQKKDSSFSVLGFVNLPFLREFSYFFSTVGKLIRWAFKNRKVKEKCVYSSIHFTPVSAAIVYFTKLMGIKRVITFTDLSLFTYQEDRVRKMPIYKRALIKPYVNFTNILQKSYNGYILFSKQMAEIVNPQNNPFCVLEGIYNPGDLNLTPVLKEDAVAHAGTLMQQVGIGYILDVHEKVSLPTQLWLIGDGDMREEILSRKERDSRIQFLGFMPRKDVFERLKAAKLLLILRDPLDEYTRYSFPSKLFEYMVSGTPVFMTRLDGIPEEYYQYVYSVENLDVERISLQIEELLKLPQTKLDEKGQAARQFILEEKNAKVQGEKVYTFLTTLLKQ